ncbi:MAG: NAD(P)/FAD-dependent oxidoreductase [Deltaproteobacteria bacterium]|nr:NAD(P)/FAD-dependent oxidoreductase [Deltaproteobacteria bacterium]
MKEYDAIIIGTGIGGAAVGALLAHAGRKVFICDKNKIVGGRCTSYEHKGFTLDLGVHLFGVGDKGSLGEVLRMTKEPDAIEWVIARRSTQQVGGESKKYSQKDMIRSLPENEQTNLTNLFGRVHTITDQEIDELWYVPVETWVNGYTKHPLAHAFINSIVAQYFCVAPQVASAAEFIKCFKEVLVARSSAYPKGGCIAIPKAYLMVLEKYGGEVKLNAAVQKIIVENGTAVGIRLEDGSELRAPVIISNADIKATVAELAGSEHFPKEYAEKIAQLTWAASCIMYKVGLKEKVTDDQLRMSVSPAKPPQDASEVEKGIYVPEMVSGMIVVPTNYDSALGPDEDKQLICFGTGMPDTKTWGKLEWDKWQQTLRRSLLSSYPEAEDKILWEKMDTPQLVEAYAGEEGNIIGVGQTVDQIHERRPSVVSPLKGLYFASAEAGGHGIGTELAASSAIELFKVLASEG